MLVLKHYKLQMCFDTLCNCRMMRHIVLGFHIPGNKRPIEGLDKLYRLLVPLISLTLIKKGVVLDFFDFKKCSLFYRFIIIVFAVSTAVYSTRPMHTLCVNNHLFIEK